MFGAGRNVDALYLIVAGGEANRGFIGASLKRLDGEWKRTGCDEGGGVIEDDKGGGDASAFSCACGEDRGGVEGTTASFIVAILAIAECTLCVGSSLDDGGLNMMRRNVRSQR